MMEMRMTEKIAGNRPIMIPHRAFGDQRLAGSHYRIIAAIAEHIAAGANGAGCIVPQSELAAAAGVHATTAPRLIADLVEWRYVATTRSDSDRRRLSYALIHGDTPNNNPPEPEHRAKDPPQRAKVPEIPSQLSDVGAGPERSGANGAIVDGAEDSVGPSGDVTASPAIDTPEEIGTELPANWPRTMDRLTAAEEARATQNLPWIDLDPVFDRFTQHYRGTGIRRPDWDAAWIDWAVLAIPPPEPKPATNPLPARQKAQPGPAVPAPVAPAENAEKHDADYAPF
jgi:IclR helix-turn-helix domain